MQWNDHSRLVGQHAFLGASKYHWLNYDTQRLVDAFMSCQAKEKGTRLHAFAAECINLKQKLPKSKKTLNAYVRKCAESHGKVQWRGRRRGPRL